MPRKTRILKKSIGYSMELAPRSAPESGASSALSSAKSFIDEVGLQRDLLRSRTAGMAGLIADIVRIETGEMEGMWALDNGRLWVFGPKTIIGD